MNVIDVFQSISDHSKTDLIPTFCFHLSIQLFCWKVINTEYLTDWTRKWKHWSTLLFSFPKILQFSFLVFEYKNLNKLFSVDSRIFSLLAKNADLCELLKVIPCGHSCTCWTSYRITSSECIYYSNSQWYESTGKQLLLWSGEYHNPPHTAHPTYPKIIFCKHALKYKIYVL